MKITIERMTLRLPAGFEDRGAAIAEEIARELALLVPQRCLSLESLEMPPLRISRETGNGDIARAAAAAIAARIGERS